MKPSVVVCALIVCLAFTQRVRAQCEDYAGCAGQRADAQAKLSEWARGTAEAVAEERRAIATDRAYDRMMALTATQLARPTRTATPTPMPTATPMPTITTTPQPSATGTQIVVVVQVVQTIQVTVQTTTTEKRTEGGISPAGWAAIGTLVLVFVVGAVILLRPQIYMLPFRGGNKRDE